MASLHRQGTTAVQKNILWVGGKTPTTARGGRGGRGDSGRGGGRGGGRGDSGPVSKAKGGIVASQGKKISFVFF